MKKIVIGDCVFCNEEKVLKRSHAIGNSVFSKVLKECEKNVALSVRIDDKTLQRSNDSWATKQLCNECEIFFNKSFENYSLNALRGKRKEILISSLEDCTKFENINNIKMAGYILSILWRAFHSKHAAYARILLFKDDHERIKEFLKNPNEVPEGMNIRVSSLYDPNGRYNDDLISKLIISPFFIRDKNKRTVNSFIFEGNQFELVYGDKVSNELEESGFINVQSNTLMVPKKNINQLTNVVATIEHAINLRKKERGLI